MSGQPSRGSVEGSLYPQGPFPVSLSLIPVCGRMGASGRSVQRRIGQTLTPPRSTPPQCQRWPSSRWRRSGPTKGRRKRNGRTTQEDPTAAGPHQPTERPWDETVAVSLPPNRPDSSPRRSSTTGQRRQPEPVGKVRRQKQRATRQTDRNPGRSHPMLQETNPYDRTYVRPRTDSRGLTIISQRFEKNFRSRLDKSDLRRP